MNISRSQLGFFAFSIMIELTLFLQKHYLLIFPAPEKKEITESISLRTALLELEFTIFLRSVKTWSQWASTLLLFKDAPPHSWHYSAAPSIQERKTGKYFRIKSRYLFKMERLRRQKLLIIPLAPLRAFCSLTVCCISACEISRSFELYTHASKLHHCVCAPQHQWVASGPHVKMVSDQPPVNKPMTQQSNSGTPLACMLIRTNRSPRISPRQPMNQRLCLI